MNKMHHICLAASLAAFFTVGTALAAPTALPFDVTTALGSLWSNIDDAGGTSTGAAFTGSCDSSAGFNINDATSVDGSSDAYDNAWGIWVDGAVFSAGANVDLDATGRIVTAGPVAMSGLDVTHQYAFADDLEVARILSTFHNPTGSPISITVEVPVNFGSDGGTQVEGTSSTDAVFDVNDRWAVTSDGGPSDPVNTTVLYGPGSPSVVPVSVTQTLFSCAGTEGIGATFDLTIPAGGTSSLLFFAGLGSIDNSGTNDIGTALVQAAAIWDAEQTLIAAGLLDDLTQAQLGQIRNWAFVTGPGPDDDPICGNLIPVGGPHTGWGLAIVPLMLLGIWLVRRRV